MQIIENQLIKSLLFWVVTSQNFIVDLQVIKVIGSFGTGARRLNLVKGEK